MAGRRAVLPVELPPALLADLLVSVIEALPLVVDITENNEELA
jgi:hypothetical protein